MVLYVLLLKVMIHSHTCSILGSIVRMPKCNLSLLQVSKRVLNWVNCTDFDVLVQGDRTNIMRVKVGLGCHLRKVRGVVRKQG